MIKPLLLALWVCGVVFASSYVVADMKASAIAPAEEADGAPVEGIEYRSLAALTVPMIGDGEVTGYVVAKLVYTADAQGLAGLQIDPGAFVSDEAFRTFYTDAKVEFGKVSRQNLDEILAAIRTRANERIGLELIQDVLVEQIDYVDRASLMQPTSQPTEGAHAGADQTAH